MLKSVKKIPWYIRMPLLRNIKMPPSYWLDRALFIKFELPMFPDSYAYKMTTGLTQNVSYSELMERCKQVAEHGLAKEIESIESQDNERINFAYDMMKSLTARDDQRKDKIEQKASSYIAQSAIITSLATIFVTIISDKINCQEASKPMLFVSISSFAVMTASFALSIISAVNAHKVAKIARIQPGIISTILNFGSIAAKTQVLQLEFVAYHTNAFVTHEKAKSQHFAARSFAVGLVSMLALLASCILLIILYPKSAIKPTQTIQNITNNYSIFR